MTNRYEFEEKLGWYVVSAFGNKLDKVIDMLSANTNIYGIVKADKTSKTGGGYLYIKTKGEVTLKKILAQPFIWSLLTEGNTLTDPIKPLSDEEVIGLRLEPKGFRILEDSNTLDIILSGKGDVSSTKTVLDMVKTNDYKLIQILDLSFESNQQTKEFYFKSPVFATKKADITEDKIKEAVYTQQVGFQNPIKDINKIEFTLNASYRESFLPSNLLDKYVNTKSPDNLHTLPINFKNDRNEILGKKVFTVGNGLEEEPLQALINKATELAKRLLPQIQKDFNEGRYPELTKWKNIEKQNEGLVKLDKQLATSKEETKIDTENERNNSDLFLIKNYGKKANNIEKKVISYKDIIKLASDEEETNKEEIKSEEIKNESDAPNITDIPSNPLAEPSNPTYPKKDVEKIYSDKNQENEVYAEVGLVISFYGMYATCKFFYGGKEIKPIDETVPAHIVLSENVSELPEENTRDSFDDFYTLLSKEGNETFSEFFKILDEKANSSVIPYIGKKTNFISEPNFYQGTKQVKVAYDINTTLMENNLNKIANLYEKFKI